jgi:hypothetical protein
MNLGVKLSVIICALLTTLEVSAQVSLIDTALLNNSNMWRGEQSLTTTGSLLRKSSFGDIKTLNIEKGKRVEVASSKNKGFVIGSDGNRFEKTIHSKDTQSFTLHITTDGSDSIFLKLALTLLSEETRSTINLSKKSPAQSGSSTSFCNEMVVHLSKDSTKWVLRGKDYSSDVENQTYFPIISSQGDSMFVAYAKGFNPNKKIWKLTPPEGVVFFKSGVQVAALRTFFPVSIWMKKDLDKKSQQVISAIMLGLLSYNGQLPQLNQE